MTRMWILGASDPEMEMIEGLLRERGESFTYATIAGRRVRPAEAYKADGISVPSAFQIVLVECRPALHENNLVVVDHHHRGDPGYGVSPENYKQGSSLGQVLALLGEEWTEERRLCAAADHCLAAAYRGECPGVDPDKLMTWRAESRAKFQKTSTAAILAAVEETRAALRVAPRIAVQEFRTCDTHAVIPTAYECWGGYDCRPEILVADMRRETSFPELPEAAAREGVGYMSGPLVGPDGRRKFTCAGRWHEVRAWMAWARENGLVDIYGDPDRGFAGAYEP